MEKDVRRQTEEKTLQESFEELSRITDALQKDGLALEESFTLYQTGMKLLKECNEKIDAVEKKMLILDEEGEMHEF